MNWWANSVSFGDGVYKSTDGGDTWTNMELKESEDISEILSSSLRREFRCSVSVPGKLFSDSDDRGVYKTSDGGNAVNAGSNASTGCSMIPMVRPESEDPFRGHVGLSPPELDVSLRRRRTGLHERQRAVQDDRRRRHRAESDDKLAEGLFLQNRWGRIAVSVAPSKPSVVYAFVEAFIRNDALYRIR